MTPRFELHVQGRTDMLEIIDYYNAIDQKLVNTFYQKSNVGIVVVAICHIRRHPRVWKRKRNKP